MPASQIRLGALIVAASALLSHPASGEPLPLKSTRIDMAYEGSGIRIRENSGAQGWTIEYPHGDRTVSMQYESASWIDVIVESSVEDRPERGALAYHYRLRSLDSSRQRVKSFGISHHGTVTELLVPEGWLAHPHRVIPAIEFRDFLNEPRGIVQGGSQNGFGFEASLSPASQKFDQKHPPAAGVFFRQAALPGLVDCFAFGVTIKMVFPAEPPEALNDLLPNRMEDAVWGKCVGPVAFSKDRLGALAERVTRDLVEAAESGWFKDKEQQATYVELFRRAQEALRADDPEAAIVAMGRVESLVRSARQADELSQEIYALVFFNARFLERSIMLPIITRTERSR